MLISEDLDEILALSDRVAVLYGGRVVGVVDRPTDSSSRPDDGGGAHDPDRTPHRHPALAPFAVPAASLLLAAVIAGMVLPRPGTTDRDLPGDVQGGVHAPGALTATFIYATPMLFTGLCAAVAFRMRVVEHRWRRTALYRRRRRRGRGPDAGGWPRPLLIAMIVAGRPAGTLWALIPGILRAYLRTNEILMSLMLNYVAGAVHVLPDLRQHVLLA